MAEPKDLCVQPSRGPIGATPTGQTTSGTPKKEEIKMTARVGKTAPDFELNAFFEGGFKNIKLSDYKGQWVVLCFYPGDFTFV